LALAWPKFDIQSNNGQISLVHYRNPGLCRVPGALPSAFCWALGKDIFAESHTRQSPTLGNEVVYRVQDTRYRRTLGKYFFAECTRQRLLCRVPNPRQMRRSAKSRQRPSKADGRNLCRGPAVGTQQRGFFAECPPAGTRLRQLCRVSFLDTWQSIFLFFKFWQPNFLWYVPTLCRPTCTILGQL
jgi:hypothetical protein